MLALGSTSSSHQLQNCHQGLKETKHRIYVNEEGRLEVVLELRALLLVRMRVVV